MNLLDLKTLSELLKNELKIENNKTIINARYWDDENKGQAQDHTFITTYLLKNGKKASPKIKEIFLESNPDPWDDEDIFINTITKRNQIKKNIVKQHPLFLLNKENNQGIKGSVIFSIKNDYLKETLFIRIYVYKKLKEEEIELAKELFPTSIFEYGLQKILTIDKKLILN